MGNKPLVFSIIIPLYNESHIISATLDKVRDYLRATNIECELILVDDGSTDNTAKKIASAIAGNPRDRLFKNSDNKGKGAAVREGVLNANGDYVVFMDADLSTPIEELYKVANAVCMDRDTIFIGVRDEKVVGTKILRPYIRRLVSRIYNLTANMLFNLDIRDVGCGFKCFPRKIAQAVFQRQYIKGWVFDVEILLRARKEGIRIKEIPVSWTNYLPTRVNIIPDAIYCLSDLIKLSYLSLLKKI